MDLKTQDSIAIENSTSPLVRSEKTKLINYPAARCVPTEQGGFRSEKMSLRGAKAGYPPEREGEQSKSRFFASQNDKHSKGIYATLH